MSRIAWVVGSRGLLGSATRRRLAKQETWQSFDAPPLPWSAPSRFKEAARASIRALLDQAAATQASWSIVWAAGAAVTSSPAEAFERELDLMRSFLAILGEEAAGCPQPGQLFFASSAGGVYAGAQHPPFDEETPPAPLAPYGRFKLEMEAAFRSFGEAAQVSVLIGRITNLYGPGQRLDKMQGLISHLAHARFTPKPIFIFVPLETVRDYLFVDDAAALILDGLERLARATAERGAAMAVTKIFGSGDAISISTLLGHYRAINKSLPRVVLGTTPSTKHQALDLRMTSVVWPELDRREKTPIAAGFHATLIDMLRQVQG